MSPDLEDILRLDPPANPEVIGVQVTAFATANKSRTEPGDAHLCEALIRIGSVADSLRAIGVDVEKARRDIGRVISELPIRPNVLVRVRNILRQTRRTLDLLHHVRANAASAGLKEITGPYAFAVLVADTPNHALFDAMKNAGFSLFAYRSYIAHRGASESECPSKGPVRLTLHNDPFTRMDFVVSVLTQVFERDDETALAMMTRARDEGHASLASMDADFARPRLAQARSRARKLDMPLRISVEPVRSP